MKKLWIALIAVSFVGVVTYAQISIGTDSEKDKNTLEIAKKEFKDLLQYGHIEVADQWMAPTYIQHNPNVPGSLEGFKAAFGPRMKPVPIKDEWLRPPTLIIVSGNYVLLMTDQKAKDEAGREYTRDHFDMVRVGDGKIQEHWDEANKIPHGPPPAAGGGR
jgi:predicted SnoaL-like aldol condensation-catalyzing enzyme